MDEKQKQMCVLPCGILRQDQTRYMTDRKTRKIKIYKEVLERAKQDILYVERKREGEKKDKLMFNPAEIFQLFGIYRKDHRGGGSRESGG